MEKTAPTPHASPVVDAETSSTITKTISQLMGSMKNKDLTDLYIVTLEKEIVGYEEQLMIEKRDIIDFCQVTELTAECILFYIRYITVV
jgi:hypothetical protein